MKKFIVVVALVFLFCGVAQAEVKLPPTSAGAYYSIKEHGINHMETFEVLKIKDLVALELGYAGDLGESDHKGIAALSLDIKQLKLGNYIKLPILDLIAFRPALVFGLGNIDVQDMSGAKFDWGIGATIISYKF
jgi:hypothetical protein